MQLTPLTPAALAFVVLASNAESQTLVANLNQKPVTEEPESSPFGLVDFNGEALFTATVPAFGREAWLSDGTEAGTRLLADLFPGTGSSDPREWTEVAPGSWVFAANTPQFGFELWRTDGTGTGTQLVRDIRPGTDSSGLSYFELHNGEVYFYATDGVTARALWKTDGTEAGTVLVSEFPIGGAPSFTNGTENLLSTPLGLFFLTNGSFGWRLWLTDGTPGNEVLLHEEPDTDWPNQLTEFGGELYFEAGSETLGNEPWISDGTPAGTQVLTDLSPGSGNSLASEFTPFNGELFFAASVGGQRELYKTDGTVAGTIQVTDSDLPGPFSSGTSPSSLTVANGFLVFAAVNAANGAEVFGTTGQPGSFFLVGDAFPGPGSSSPQDLVEVDGKLVFRGFGAGVGSELFATDGTPGGTGLLADINSEGFASSNPSSLTEIGGLVYFAADDGDAGDELWVTDGTSAGTGLLVDLAQPQTDFGSTPFNPIGLGSRALFAANDGQTGIEPWIAGPAGDALAQLGDFAPGGDGSLLFSGLEWRGDAWFALSTPEFGSELWRSDGTAAGTELVVDLLPGPDGSLPRILGILDDELYFRATATVGNELYATDGTAAGTRLVADIWPAGSSSPIGWATVGGQAFFSAFTPNEGRELWVTDGTAVGTQLLADVWVGSNSGVQSPAFTAFDGRVFFRGLDGGLAQGQLYESDGTAAGTLQVPTTNPGGSSAPSFPRVVNGRLLYRAFGGLALGNQLFAIEPGSSAPLQLSSVNLADGGNGLDGGLQGGEDVAYVLFDEAGGASQVLLRSDGTLAGTFIVTTIDPTGAYTEWFGIIDQQTTDGRTLFNANDGLFGQELWVTDGTEAGTVRLTDINPGGGDSRPDAIQRVGSRYFFAAEDGVFGKELHSIPVTATGGWIAEPFGEGCPGSNGVPELGFAGEARIGAAFSLGLTQAAPSSIAFLFLGLTGAPSDLGGGCTALIADPVLIGALPTDGLGQVTVPFLIPNEPVLAGLNVWSQFVIADPLGAFNGAASLTGALELVIGG